MKIKILKSLAGLNFSYSAGQEIEIEDKIAAQWITAGLAEPIGGDKNELETNNSTGDRTNKSPGSKKSSSSGRKR